MVKKRRDSAQTSAAHSVAAICGRVAVRLSVARRSVIVLADAELPNTVARDKVAATREHHELVKFDSARRKKNLDSADGLREGLAAQLKAGE